MTAAAGPLVVHPDNPRYFADPGGSPVYLTGSHTWNNLQDLGGSVFDFDDFLDRLESWGHNFFRLWTWEQGHGVQWAQTRADNEVSPTVYMRSGAGASAFDLERLNDEYFRRQSERVAAALERGIYAAVMLFQGFSVDHLKEGVPWERHPLRAGNNVNGIDGDPEGKGDGSATHTLAIPEVTAIQEAYVRRVVENVNEFDNVLYEITNESPPYSTEWQYHMIEFVKAAEAALPKQHPVGMTFQYEGGLNRTLYDSPADWVSPNPDGGWQDDPTGDCLGKVVISDTDHLWGIGGDRAWVWKTFCRGHNPVFMDTWDDLLIPATGNSYRDVDPDEIRRAMGETRSFALRMDLARCVPRGELASTGYCLSDGESEFLVYQPPSAGAGEFTVKLAAGAYSVEWHDPVKGGAAGTAALDAPGGPVSLTPPSEGEAVAYIRRA